jgi:translation initiation factor IF-2
VTDAGPSTPVSVLGLSDLPLAGEVFRVVESAREARTLAARHREQTHAAEPPPRVRSLDQVFEAFQAGETQELRLIIKADVQGSLEPIVSSLKDLSAGDIHVNILHAATGNISADDVMLAAASDTIIIGFNVEVDQGARRSAEAEGVDIRTYDVIYRLTEDIEKALKGMLEPEKRSVELGRAEVRAVFRIPKVGNIAGCLVTKGEIRRNAQIRVIRGGKVLHEGPISSLRHLKDDVREVREGFECGIGVRGFDEFETGDRLDCFAVEVVAAE